SITQRFLKIDLRRSRCPHKPDLRNRLLLLQKPCHVLVRVVVFQNSVASPLSMTVLLKHLGKGDGLPADPRVAVSRHQVVGCRHLLKQDFEHPHGAPVRPPKPLDCMVSAVCASVDRHIGKGATEDREKSTPREARVCAFGETEVEAVAFSETGHLLELSNVISSPNWQLSDLLGWGMY